MLHHNSIEINGWMDKSRKKFSMNKRKYKSDFFLEKQDKKNYSDPNDNIDKNLLQNNIKKTENSW